MWVSLLCAAGVACSDDCLLDRLSSSGGARGDIGAAFKLSMATTTPHKHTCSLGLVVLKCMHACIHA